MKTLPLLLLEAKGTVAGSVKTVTGHNICQLGLEAYYALQEYGINRVLGCLSDTTTWHFFMFKPHESEHGGGPLLDVVWEHSIRGDELPALENVISFAAAVVIEEIKDLVK